MLESPENWVVYEIMMVDGIGGSLQALIPLGSPALDRSSRLLSTNKTLSLPVGTTYLPAGTFTLPVGTTYLLVVTIYYKIPNNGVHHWEDTRQYFFKAEINNTSPGKVYSDKKIISVVRVVVKRKWGYGFLSSIMVRRSDKQEYTFSYADLPRLNLNDIEDMYLLKVQDKMHHLLSDDEKDFNNALLLFIRRTIIKNRVEDLQLGVESYKRTVNLTKPKLYFDGIDEKIPYTMSGLDKGVVYLNKYNRRSLMK
ncbi:hypothetical protein Tco_0578533 [Tanacetum coccineum]